MSGKRRPCYAGSKAVVHSLPRRMPFAGSLARSTRSLAAPLSHKIRGFCGKPIIGTEAARPFPLPGLTGRMSGCPCFAGAQRCCASLGNGLGRSVISPRQHSRAYARAPGVGANGPMLHTGNGPGDSIAQANRGPLSAPHLPGDGEPRSDGDHVLIRCFHRFHASFLIVLLPTDKGRKPSVRG